MIIEYDKNFVLEKTLQELSKDEILKVLKYESLVKLGGDKGLRDVNELIGLSSPDDFKVSKEEILQADRTWLTVRRIYWCMAWVNNP